MKSKEILHYNRNAWNENVRKGDRWTVPVTAEEIRRAAAGELSLLLTPSRTVPGHWFPELPGLRVLCLASGGGQQGPLLAAAGAEVVVYDISPGQLARDRQVAEREGLALQTVEGDMADLRVFADASFDLIFHPCSICFSEVVLPVWREAFRVLRPGGRLLSGLVNPVLFLFDRELERQGIYQLRYSMPYSDISCLPAEELETMRTNHEPLAFAHSLEDQIGGQLRAGFRLIDLYEDDWGGEDPIDRYFKGYLATLAEKPA